METDFRMSRSTFRKKHMLNLKGKDYLPVAARIVEFRQDHPDWAIITETKEIGDKLYVFATIQCMRVEPCIYDGSKFNPVPWAVATAHKEVGKAQGGAARWPLETAETGAIGRALGLCGYGTIEGGDFDEGDQLADAPVASATTSGSVTVSAAEAHTDAVEELIKKINRCRKMESLLGIKDEAVAVGQGLPEGSDQRNRLREALMAKEEKLK